MSDGFSADRRLELIDVIRRVRNRWRMRLALRGAVIVVTGTLLALLLSASSLEALRFSPTAIITFRLAAFIVFAGLALDWLRPAAAQTGQRLAGGAVSRGKRPVAADGAAQRRRIVGHWRPKAPSVRRRGWSRTSRRTGHRQVPSARRRPRRAPGPATAAHRARRWPPRPRCSSCSVPPSCVMVCRRCWSSPERRGGEPVSHRRAAGKHQDPARRRPDGHRAARRLLLA